MKFNRTPQQNTTSTPTPTTPMTTSNSVANNNSINPMQMPLPQASYDESINNEFKNLSAHTSHHLLETPQTMQPMQTPHSYNQGYSSQGYNGMIDESFAPPKQIPGGGITSASLIGSQSKQHAHLSHEVDNMTSSIFTAEQNRTSMLLQHISSLRSIVKSQLDEKQSLEHKYTSQQQQLREASVFAEFLTDITASKDADEMFIVTANKLQHAFQCQLACIYVVESATHELITRRNKTTEPGNNLIFQAAHSEFPFNLSAEDPALITHNASLISNLNNKLSSSQITNILIARLTDDSNKVVGVVTVANHLDQPRFTPRDETRLSMMMRSLTNVAVTIEKSRVQEDRVKTLQVSLYEWSNLGWRI